nr:MAG TPA: hypothetical protein [Caudoviricetes sp.]
MPRTSVNENGQEVALNSDFSKRYDSIRTIANGDNSFQ